MCENVYDCDMAATDYGPTTPKNDVDVANDDDDDDDDVTSFYRQQQQQQQQLY